MKTKVFLKSAPGQVRSSFPFADDSSVALLSLPLLLLLGLPVRVCVGVGVCVLLCVAEIEKVRKEVK